MTKIEYIDPLDMPYALWLLGHDGSSRIHVGGAKSLEGAVAMWRQMASGSGVEGEPVYYGDYVTDEC